MNLTPIKVKIGTKNNGQAKYPNFNALQVVIQANADWSKYIDIHGTGWLYDSIGHKEIRAEGHVDHDSPHGQQWGMILVPQTFAQEAVAMFPNEVEIIDETKCQDFYDNCHAIEFDEEEIDQPTLDGIKAKQDLGQPLTARQNKALDPSDNTKGIRKNWRKTFTDFKAKKGINII